MIMPKYTNHQQVRTAIVEGREHCTTLVDYYLQQVERRAGLNAYVEVFAEEARHRARELDAKYEANPESVGRLFGMVLSIKDVICYRGRGVTAASRMLSGFESVFSATAVERLLAEDAIIIGRTNCDEFAMGSTNETSYYGPTRNALDENRIPGGSSGGAAVAVQADTCLAALGSDTGGSVRQPAALCGLVGLKPSYGRISRHGLLAYGSSFDQIGVFSHSVADAALLLEVMAGGDAYDSTASQEPPPSYSRHLEAKGKVRLAYFRNALEHEGLDPYIRELAEDTIDRLRAEGHTVEAVDFDYLDYLVPAYYVLTTAEASSNLARYDGIRYGRRSKQAGSLLETYQQSRTEGFGREVKRRIMLGTFVLSAGYYDAYYTKAQQARRLIFDRTRAIFADYDFILTPTTPAPAWPIGQSLDDPVAMYLADIFTVQANLTGIPAISLPLGAHEEGLPLGMQLMADQFREADLLAFSHQWMRGIGE